MQIQKIFCMPADLFPCYIQKFLQIDLILLIQTLEMNSLITTTNNNGSDSNNNNSNNNNNNNNGENNN